MGLFCWANERWLAARSTMGFLPIFCLWRAEMKLDSVGLESLLSPTVDGLGYELWGIDFRSSQKHAHLKVYIDSEKGITVDDCSDVSHQISGLLDVEDPISVPYTLEVSSPGVERPLMKLAHFERYVGSDVKVRLSWPVNNRRNFLGTLKGVNADEITMDVDEESVVFPFNAIKRANLIFE